MSTKPSSIFLSAALITVACLVFTSISHSQEMKVKLLKKVSYQNEPLNFVNIKNKANPVYLDTEFVADDYWLRDTTFEIQNVSDQNIVAFEISMVVPRTKGRERPTGLIINYGNLLQIERGKITVPPVPPGGKVELKVLNDVFSNWEKLVTAQDQLSNVNKAHIFISDVLFEDWTRWVAGDILYQNPDNKKEWKIKGGTQINFKPSPSSDRATNLHSKLGEVIKLEYALTPQLPRASYFAALFSTEAKSKDILSGLRKSSGFCTCGADKLVYEDCCVNGGCSVIYPHKTIDCNQSPKYQCCPFDGVSCNCYPGSFCPQCFYVDCENGACP